MPPDDARWRRCLWPLDWEQVWGEHMGWLYLRRPFHAPTGLTAALRLGCLLDISAGTYRLWLNANLLSTHEDCGTQGIWYPFPFPLPMRNTLLIALHRPTHDTLPRLSQPVRIIIEEPV
ncbi:MAG: hypothetical protein KatS3mg114_1391 [Planctomycetaceae bacterium]|nr:MAG: hypothetical protein KatS3mg114_1391 [Planctomycetaceae bacterium]